MSRATMTMTIQLKRAKGLIHFHQLLVKTKPWISNIEKSRKMSKNARQNRKASCCGCRILRMIDFSKTKYILNFTTRRRAATRLRFRNFALKKLKKNFKKNLEKIKKSG